MLKPLLITRWILLLIGLLGASNLYATHIQAGEISYQSLGANRYKVLFRVYRDCGGAMFPASVDLEYRTTGCTGVPWPRAAMTLVPGSQRIGNNYCATIGSPCGVGRPTNYETGEFTTTVTLAPGQWTLSVFLNARPDVGNIVTGTGNFYTEATLDTRTVATNSSPVFSSNSQVVSFVGWRLPTSFSEMALDPDGDSLTYELVAPLESCGTAVQYAVAPQQLVPDPSAPGCFVNLPSLVYSPGFPMPSYGITGACPLRQAQPYFSLDPASGSIAMVPALYDPAVNSALNKNVVAVKVSEYRYRQNPGGSRTAVLVGTLRRDMLFTVVDCGNNQNPLPSPVLVNGSSAPQAATTPIAVVPGQLVTVRLAGADPNATQLLTMTSNVEQVLPNSELTITGPSAHPTAQIDWIPPLTLAPGLYYCTVTTTDDACPIKGVQTQTLTFRVGNRARATAPARQLTTLAATPTPFQSQVRFTLSKPGVQTVLVFDHLGRQVATLQSQPSGEVQWHPAAGQPAGLYLARTADGRQVARLLRTAGE
ncbi:hypothetical protein [Hymenobacter persicinus]|uniref:T9SS type A sorting domain-containing protein n=1 Tax=Hymenobacter persicinus TaxID=2025506 RepID=A0A4Q5LDZ5_9BACT|nr:hypothetical protein [Hymenobacter persicinus]RYU81898.1 hypothetical protein EWM57_05815 [Hymenobacter persicinus]